MDSTAFSTTTSTNEEKSIIVSSKHDIFLSTYNSYQQWSLPDSVVFYMAKNPSSPKCYQKTIQSCKYFFIKNPLLVISRCIEYQKNGWNISCEKQYCCVNEKSINLRNGAAKLWISGEIEIRNYVHNNFNCISSLIPKIHQSDVKKLVLNYLNISLNDLMFLATSKCEILWLNLITVIEENGAVVKVEKLVEAFPNIKHYYYQFGDNASIIVTFETVKELIKIPHFSNLDYFVLYNIPENFDIDTFYSYIKENKKTKIELRFFHHSQEYGDRLHAIVDEILSAESREYRPPYIDFTGMDMYTEARLRHLDRN